MTIDIVTQIIALLALMIGILLGEELATKAFGRIKPIFLIIDIIIFVVIITLLYSFLAFTELGIIFYLINFGLGFVTIIIVRGIEGGLGLTEMGAAQEKITINMIRALARYGLSNEEIKGVLKRSGFSPKTVDSISDVIEQSIPAYAPKLLKISSEVEDIKGMVLDIKKRVTETKSAAPGEIKDAINRLRQPIARLAILEQQIDDLAKEIRAIRTNDLEEIKKAVRKKK